VRLCCDGDVGAHTPDDPVALRGIAEQLAAEAAAFVRARRAELFGTGPDGGPATGADDDPKAAVRTKSTPTDPVTVVDTGTERLLRDRLAELRPGDHVFGEEEGGAPVGREDQLTWVLDPIDGTVNFLYGIEAYAVSVAVQRGGTSIAGAVADVAAGAVYSAAAGHGAQLRPTGAGAESRPTGTVAPLRCNAVTDLSMSLVGTGFSYSSAERARQARILTEVLPAVRDVRRLGSAALDLCMVAAGRLDAYYEDGVHLWDWAAGALIAAEAGAVVHLPPVGAGPGRIVAAAPGIAAALDDLLRRAGFQ